MHSLSQLLESVQVEERRGVITVKGLPQRQFNLGLERYFQTKRIQRHMFIRLKRQELSFPSFFAVEFDYMLTTLMRHSSRAVAYRVLEQIRTLLYRNTWLANTLKEHESRLNPRRLKRLKKRPLDHQQEFFDFYDHNTQRYSVNGYLLAAPPGAGKTLTGLMLFEQLEHDRLIVVCPNNAIDRVWKNTLENEYRQDPGHYELSNRQRNFGTKARIYVVHFEALDKILEVAESFSDEKVMIILDESHYFNEPTSQRTQKFLKLVETTKAEDVLWASGTPIKALGKEMIPLLRSIDPRFNDNVEERFKAIFGLEAARAIEILSHRLGIVTYKVAKEKVVSGEPRHDTLWVGFGGAEQYTLEALAQEMSSFVEQRLYYYQEHLEEYRANYNRCLRIFEKAHEPMDRSLQQRYQQYKSQVRQLERTRNYREHKETIQQTNAFENEYILPVLEGRDKHIFRDAKSVIKYVELKIQGEALGMVLTRRRIDAHLDMIPHTPWETIIETAEKKTVIFTSFVEVLEQIQAHLRDKGYRPEVVYGQTNKELEGTIRQFEAKSSANPLIATYQSLSTAVPLTMANTVILFNQPFREYIREQAVSRLYRIGQDREVFVYSVLLDTGGAENISTRARDIVDWSKKQVDELLDINTDNEQQIAQFFDEQNYTGRIGDWRQMVYGLLPSHSQPQRMMQKWLSW